MVDCTVNLINSEKKETDTIKKTKKSNKTQYSGTICKKQVINIKK